MIDDFSIDYDKWAEPKPFGFSGCFRLRNESQFMEKAILSHLPYLDEAVLVVQPSDDDTFEIASRLEFEYPHKIRVEFYPFVPDWIDTPGFYAKDPNAPGHLVHMSNWAFSKCNYSWIVKVEGDVICLSSFQNIIDRINTQPFKKMYYGRVILNLAGPNCDMISKENPRNGGWDEAVVPNHPDYHFERRNKWEVLVHNGPELCMGWSGLHMKRCKVGKDKAWNGETYIPFNEPNVRHTLAEFNNRIRYVGIDDPLGEPCIYEKDWL